MYLLKTAAQEKGEMAN